EQIFTSCGRKVEDYIPIRRLDPSYEIRFGDGTRLDMGRAEEMQERFAQFNQRDAERLPALLRDMHKKYVTGRYKFIDRPFNHIGDLLHPSTMGGLAQALPLESCWRYVSRYCDDPRLRQALTFQTLYLGTSPMDCPSIYGFLPYVEMEFGVWFPVGGMYAVAAGLARLFQELGGKLECGVGVREIQVRNGTAEGVCTDDGRCLKADAVISNCDVQTTYTQLIDAAHRPSNTDRRMWKHDSGCSGFLLYLGVRRLPPGWKHHTLILPEDYTGVMDDMFHKRCLPREPALYACVPTCSDPSLAPEGHHILYVLAPVPNLDAHVDWQGAAPEFRDRCIRALVAAGWDGLEDDIVLERRWTPHDFMTKYGLFRGSAFGLSCTFWQSAYFRPHNRSEDIRNLYLVGASTHPGGGVPIVLTSAKLVAEAVEADARKRARKPRFRPQAPRLEEMAPGAE
ncbi:MAG TPA: phytoene desaturase family protein, partial [Armatimonadota bacterium]|nr:phytoene desaturase family protein [Armatimonadota bacterium]